MSQPYCIVESACCEWKDYMVGPAVYGPMDEDEAEAACLRLNASVSANGPVHFTVRPMQGVPLHATIRNLPA